MDVHKTLSPLFTFLCRPPSSCKAAHARMTISDISKPFLVLISSMTTFVVFSIIFLNPLFPLVSLTPNAPSQRSTDPVEHSSVRQPKNGCPVLVYNKQMKTGSTVISNVIYRTTEAYGCRNAPCFIHKLLMAGNATHVGTHNGITMSCHARELNKDLVRFLRIAHGNNFVFVASVREPTAWFKSAASYFYRQKHPERGIPRAFNDSHFRDAVDWLMEPEHYNFFEKYLFDSLGLSPYSSSQEMLQKLLGFDIIIDNAEMKEGLAELGKLLGWKMLEPTGKKSLTYRGPLYNTYRANEIKSATRRVALLYKKATEIRNARRVRPPFGGKEVTPDEVARVQENAKEN